MNDILLSIAYFPPISYFAAMAQSKSVMIEANEHYQKKTYRSRCYIAGPHGKQTLNIPIIRPSNNQTKIKDALIGGDQNWQKQHWNSIITAYNSSPFLLYYQDEIKDTLFKKYDTIWELNNELLKLLIELLQLNIEIKYTSEYKKSYESILDYRELSSPKSNIKINDYIQVFGDKHGFINDLSILDLLFNLGPEASSYLLSINLD